jgi:hypothetical protein
MHPFQVCIPVKCAIFLTKIRVHILLFKHISQSHLPRMDGFFTFDIQCHSINVLLKCFKRSSHFVIHMSSFRLNARVKQLVIHVENIETFEVGSTFRFTKCLDRLDFVIDRWFFFDRIFPFLSKIWCTPSKI